MPPNAPTDTPDRDSNGVGYPKPLYERLSGPYNVAVPDTRGGMFGKCSTTSQIIKNPAGRTVPIVIPISGEAFLAEQLYALPGFPTLLPNLNTEEWDVSWDDYPGPIRIGSVENEIMSLTGDISGENFFGSQSFYKRGWLYVAGVVFSKLVVQPVLGVESYLRVTAFQRPLVVQRGR